MRGPSKKPIPARKLGKAELVLAYELREEYGMAWKTIAKMIGHNHNTLRSYVWRAINKGLPA